MNYYKKPITLINKKNTILFIFCLFSTSFLGTVSAQEKAKIIGRVSDERNNSLEYATVGVFNISNPIGTSTTPYGKYSLIIPAKIELILIASFTGFESQKIKVFYMFLGA